MNGLATDTRTTRFEFDENYLRALEGRDEAAENQLITSLVHLLAEWQNLGQS